MIIDDKPLDVKLSQDFEANAFTIAANAKAFAILSDNIYTNKVRAVIRESCCNAHDSHVDAGNPEPFKVHLPTMLEPWYSVRDFGTSMDHDTCMKLYSTYFHSTKTKSNEFTGCLGIGSKSPLCLVDSFKVRAMQNGEERIYSVFKGADSCPQIALLIRQETDEPDGLEVSIECGNRNDEFAREAASVLSHFSVIPDVNVGWVKAEIEDHQDYQIDTNGIKIRESRGHGRGLKAVMGNVSYNIPDELYDFTNLSGFIEFPVGSLSFDPGRENLSLDEKTVNAIKTRMQDVKQLLFQGCKDELEQHDTFFKRCVAYAELRKTSLGRTISGTLAADPDIKTYHIPEPTEAFTMYSGQYRTNKYETFELTLPIGENKVMYFKTQPRFEQRIRKFINSHSQGFRPTIVLLTDEQIAEMKIDDKLILDLETTIPKLKRSANTSQTCKVKTFIWNGLERDSSSDWDEATVDLADKTQKVYVEINRFIIKNGGMICDTYRLKRMEDQLKQAGGKIELPIYGLKTAYLKTAAFQNGNWISASDYVKKQARKAAPKVIYKPDRYAGELHCNAKTMLLSHELPEEFARYVELKNIYNNQTESLFESFSIAIDRSDELATISKEIFEKYPMLRLINKISSTEKQCVIDYITEINERPAK